MRAAFAFNVTGALSTVQAMLPMLGEGARAAVISSRMGVFARPGGSAFAYRAAKAAATDLATDLAVAPAPRGIAVGAFHPGCVRAVMGGEGADPSHERSARGPWDGMLALCPGLTGEGSGVLRDHDGAPLPF